MQHVTCDHTHMQLTPTGVVDEAIPVGLTSLRDELIHCRGAKAHGRHPFPPELTQADPCGTASGRGWV